MKRIRRLKLDQFYRGQGGGVYSWSDGSFIPGEFELVVLLCIEKDCKDIFDTDL